MDNKRIAFQGEPGAYSEEALFLLEPRAQSQPYREFRDVTQAVVDGRADLGLLPIESGTLPGPPVLKSSASIFVPL